MTSSCTDLGLSSPRANGSTNDPGLRVAAYGVGGPDGVDARVWSKGQLDRYLSRTQTDLDAGPAAARPGSRSADHRHRTGLVPDPRRRRNLAFVGLRADQWPCGSALGTDRPGQFGAGDQRGNPSLVMARQAARDPTTNHREYDFPIRGWVHEVLAGPEPR